MKLVLAVLLLLTPAFAQNSTTQPADSEHQPAAIAMQSSDLQHMQMDLNNLRSMLNAMGSQINTVRDPAVRDALRTNEQMWMYLINELQARVNAANRSQR